MEEADWYFSETPNCTRWRILYIAHCTKEWFRGLWMHCTKHSWEDISRYYTGCVVTSNIHHKPPSNVQKFYGEDLSLHCSATGQASISWKRASGAWEEGRMTVQGGTIKISNLKKSDSGSYICEAKLPLYSIETTAVLAVLNIRGKYQDWVVNVSLRIMMSTLSFCPSLEDSTHYIQSS